MNTLVIWYEPENANSPIIDAELHFNLWKIKKKFLWKNFFHFDYFLDVGLMISNLDEVKCIYIYIPGVIKSKDIKDIGGTLQESEGALRAVFNEEFSRSQVPEIPSMYIVKDKKDKAVFNIYKLDISLEMKIENVVGDAFKGSILKIANDVKSTAEGHKVYYRFRISSNFIKKIVHTHVPANSILESFSTNTEIIDFRLNENRNIPTSILNKVKKLSQFNLSKIHFLVLRNIKDDFIFSNKKIHNSRELEKNIWNDYVSDKEYNYNKILAYHFKQMPSEGVLTTEFNLLVKFRYEKTNMLVIIKYLLIIFFIELFINKISNHINIREWFNYIISFF